MVSESTIQFLKDLKTNNNREWFLDNKKRYETVKKEYYQLTADFLDSMKPLDPALELLEVKNCVFRINRDIRFSKDKSPYKTNFGVGLGMGKGNKISGYYLHIEPGKSFLAGGVYQPEPSVLKEIRKEISMNAKEFQEILQQDDFRNNFRGLSVEGKLQRVPNGFEKDDSMAEFLKLKNFIVVHPISDDALMGENATKNIAKIFKSMKPLNDFLSAPFL